MHSFRLFNELLVSQASPTQLEQYLKSHKIQYQSKKIKNSIHIRSIAKGFQVQYQELNHSLSKQKNFCLSSIFLYINNCKNKQYSSQFSLPYNLSHKMPIKAVVMLLGQPTTKSKYFTECIWKNLGIDIIFLSMNYSSEDAPIDYICLYSRDRVNICSVCHDNLKQDIKCQNCGIVQYCSLKCKEKHDRLHKMYCQTIDQGKL